MRTDNDEMTTSWDKFCLLMWKNWLLQIRHKVQTIVEILIPVAFSGLLVLIRSLVDPKDYPTYTYDELRIDNFTDTR
jgi:ATP-binding cassette, subfamily A (ABC1), member 3